MINNGVVSGKMNALGFLFTRNVSLDTWVKTGMLERGKMIHECEIEQNIYQEIYWFTYGINDKEIYDDLVRQGRLSPQIKVIPMPRVFKGRLGYDVYSILMPLIQRKYFRRLNLVRSNQMDGAWTGLVAKWIYGIPFYFRTGYTNTMFYERMNGKRDLNFKKFAKLEELLYQKCDLATVTSEHDKEYVCNSYGIAQDKVVVLVNHIDTKKFYDMEFESRKERIVFVGRLTEQKNLFHTIEAVKEAGLGLDIYGRGDLNTELKEFAKKINADVEFKGTVPNDELPWILNCYKYYILASDYEGMPKTLLEAMACGNLCIGTRVEGIEEVITDNENGFLASETSVESIEDAIARAMKDKKYREKIEMGKKLINEKYSLQSVINKECELCSKIKKK